MDLRKLTFAAHGVFQKLLVVSLLFSLTACVISTSSPPKVTYTPSATSAKTYPTPADNSGWGQEGSGSGSNSGAGAQPNPSRTTPNPFANSPLAAEFKGHGINFVSGYGDPDAARATSFLEPIKQEFFKRSGAIKNVKFHRGFHYDYVTQTLTVDTEDKNITENFAALDSVLEFSAQIGIPVDTGRSYVMYLVWPSLKAKLSPVKSKLKLRAKYIKLIEAINIDDFYHVSSGTLFVNETRDESYLNAALSGVDKLRGFLDVVDGSKLNIESDYSSGSPYKKGYDTFQLLTPYASRISKLIQNYGVKRLTVKENLMVRCEFAPLTTMQSIVIYGFRVDETRNDNHCAPSELVKRIELTLKFQAETSIAVYEIQSMGLGPNVPTGASLAALNALMPLTELFKAKSGQIKTVRFGRFITKANLSPTKVLDWPGEDLNVAELKAYLEAIP